MCEEEIEELVEEVAVEVPSSDSTKCGEMVHGR